MRERESRVRCSGTTTTPDTNLYLLLSGTVLREKTDTNSQASGSDLRRSGANRFARPFGDFVLHWIDGGKRDRLRPRRDLGPPFPPSGAASHYGGQKKRKKEASARQIRIDNNKIIFRTVFKKTPSECCCIFPRRDHYALLRSSGLRALSLRRSLFVYINLSLSSSFFFFYKGKEKEGNEFVRSAKEEEALVATQSINI